MSIKWSNGTQISRQKCVPVLKGLIQVSSRCGKCGTNCDPFSTMTCFHIHSGDYLVILYSFRNLCGRLKW
ncbi:hypothetical protein E2C01_102319 [Portunus trituberculatus]|uniref:Uncharacterized protein n=1 Tax=Portunus trituberculatus TaxID=210409 RepID=A0A5B7KNX4_PORTR|nr:hypothetical protein [Portunus trituberculatus]